AGAASGRGGVEGAAPPGRVGLGKSVDAAAGEGFVDLDREALARPVHPLDDERAVVIAANFWNLDDRREREDRRLEMRILQAIGRGAAGLRLLPTAVPIAP